MPLDYGVGESAGLENVTTRAAISVDSSRSTELPE